jgi:plasmid stabilization system protein ParE
MRFTIGISPRAGQDLEDIVFFLTAREQDAEPAERFASALVEKAKRLADFPHRGKGFQRYLRVRKRISQSANTKPVEFQAVFLGLRTDKQKKDI